MTASAGALFGWPVGGVNDQRFSFGVEASFMHYFGDSPEAGKDIGVGAFTQADVLAHHERFALGLQAGNWIGLELGPALRTADGQHSGDLGLHAGLYLTTGIVGIDVRDTLPLLVMDSSRPSLGNEVAVLVTLKVPFMMRDVDFCRGCFQ